MRINPWAAGNNLRLAPPTPTAMNEGQHESAWMRLRVRPAGEGDTFQMLQCGGCSKTWPVADEAIAKVHHCFMRAADGTAAVRPVTVLKPGLTGLPTTNGLLIIELERDQP